MFGEKNPLEIDLVGGKEIVEENAMDDEGDGLLAWIMSVELVLRIPGEGY